MPNSTKGGGVSRKIDDEQDRDRLKRVAKELTLELGGQGAVIVRTAGAYKTKAEIKKDCAYLQKLWDNIRKNIIKSNAPTFIHEEGDVIKKSIRDLYDNDMEEIIVAGEEAFDNASNFMKLLLPKHVSKLKLYKGKTPLFIAEGVEEKLAAFYENKVLLNSGGYLIINPTEALVAIDVNSGKATLERSIEDTAFKTNISAAYKLAEHAKIRDLSGLIVIDFIDMEDSRNQRAVEKALRDAFSHDKARVQIGKMSQFGLIEMTRQRLRQSYLEANTKTCDHCQGRGKIRSLEATSIVVLRAIENEIALSHDNEEVHVSGTSALMFHIMNKNRNELAALEQRYPNKITFYADESAGGDGFFIEKKKIVRDYNDIKALSGIVDHTTDAEKDNAAEQNNKHKSKRKMRFKKNHHNHPHHAKKGHVGHNFEARQNDISFDISEQPQHSENKFNDYDSPRKFKRKDHRKPQEKVYREKESPDELNEHNFDKEMAERRKDNQSLLKEIWKKIVD
jgi:ribonuclease E